MSASSEPGIRRTHARLALYLILALGLAFRLWGLAWGLPERTDLHPDEHDYVLDHALHVTFAHPDPGFLNYPSFLMYLISLTFGGLRRLHLIAGEEWQAYYIGRLWSAFFATATILPVYRLARELGGTRLAGLLAGLFMALLPLNIWEAHFAITDPLMTFWIALTLLASVRLVRTGRWRDYAFAGIALGLATGSKYTAALATVAVVAGALTARRPWRNTVTGLCLAAGCALACAFVVMPFSFIRLPDLLRAMAYEHAHVNGNHYGFSLPANGWQYRRGLYRLAAAWPFSFGLALYACVAAGTVWTLRRFDRRKLPVFVFAALFGFVTCRWTFVPLRYYMPLLLVGALCAGLWLGHLLETPRRRGAGLALLAAALACTLVFDFQTTARFTRETRQQAGYWLDRQLQPGQSLLVAGWHRYLALPTCIRCYRLEYKSKEAPLNRIETAATFDLVEISSMHHARHLRHGNDGMLAIYQELRDPRGDFELVARFDSDFLNKKLYERLDPMFGGYFVSPTLEFYRPKRKPAPAPATT